MAAVIRLARHGGKKKPFYRIVVTDRRFAADGRRLEQVGIYDPHQSPSRIEFKVDRLREWWSRGARPSPRVAELMKQSGADKALQASPEAALAETP